MSFQNLVSNSISPELKTTIQTHTDGLKTAIAGLVTQLLPDDKRTFAKAGNAMMPFIDKSHLAYTQHPEILPQIFDAAEYDKDYCFAKDLAPIYNVVSEIKASLEDTYFAVCSDLMVESLEIYAAVQQHKNKVAGLEVTAAELSAFFKRPKRSGSENPPIPQ